MIVPFEPPLQVTLVLLALTVTCAGCVSVTTWQVASTVTAEVVLEQPFEELVNVNVTLPVVEPAVTTPAFVTDAIEGLLLTQVPPVVGDKVVVEPAQIVELPVILTVGNGFTVTVTVNVLPAQVPEVGVTVYVAVCAVTVAFVSVPLMLDAPLPEAPPVIPPVTVGADQLYVVPARTTPLVPFTGVAVNAVPLQVVAVIAVMDDLGFTVTVTVNVFPGHEAVVDVTVYVAVCAVVVGFVNVPLMPDAPLPDAPPVIPPVTVGADQL